MTDPFTPEQAQALRRVRLAWWITVAVIAPLPFIALPVTGAGWLDVLPHEAYPSAAGFTTLTLVLGAATLVAGLLARNQAYKQYWRADTVTPHGYVKGNRLFFALLAGGAVAIAVAGMAVGYPAPTFAAAPVYVGLLLLNRPHGKPMRPHPPRLGEDHEYDRGDPP